MSGWPLRRIGDLAAVIAGQSPEGTHYNDRGDGLPFYQGKKEFGDKYIGSPQVWTRVVTKEAHKNDILISVRAPVGPVNFATELCCIGRGLAAIRPGPNILSEFLFYFLKHYEPSITGNAGAVFPSINKSQIEAILIPFPPLVEQKRIVAILDEAFEGIAMAAANAKRNLTNAQELFEGFLADFFSRREAGWQDRDLRSICKKITVGHVGSMAKRYVENGIPFLRSQNIRPFQIELDGLVYIDETFHGELGKSNLRAGDVAIVRTGYPGTAAVIPESLGTANCSDLVIVRPGPEVDAHFLAAFFNSSFGKALVNGKLVGAAQKHFNITAAKETVLHLPSLAEQQNLVTVLDGLRSNISRLEKVYLLKASFLNELKVSLLRKAFSGQFTGKKAIAAAAQVSSSVDTTNPAFTADILAFAYSKHQAANRNRTFGRVKGQKVLHLVESIVGIELGRVPIKDAAGPNDSAHMRKAETWAAENDYFTFVQRRGGGHDFVRGKSFDRLYAGAHARQSTHRAEIGRIVDLLLPMDSVEAEVFATVHAAWNNLLLDGKSPTDAEILHEARENWHPSKLNIPRSKFLDALRRIKTGRLVPTGSGKRVGGQENLL